MSGTHDAVHFIEEAIGKLEQYDQHAKQSLQKYYALKQMIAEKEAADAPQTVLETTAEPPKNEYDASRDPRLRR